MVEHLKLLLVAALVVLAGCSTGGGPPSTTAASTDPPVGTPTTVASPTAEGPAPPTASPTARPAVVSAHQTTARPPTATLTPTPDPTDRFPVPPDARPTYAPDPDPPVSPDTQIQAFDLDRHPAAVTDWYRDPPGNWTLRYVTPMYNPDYGWLNRLVLTRGETLAAIWIASAPNGSEVTVSLGTGVVADGERAVIAELGFGSVTFTVSPLAPDAIDHVTPLGGLSPPGHTLPTDHSYLAVTGADRPSPVYAPADGIITNVGFHRLGDPAVDDFDMVILHSNSHLTKLGHMASLDPALRERIGSLEAGYQDVFVRIEAGERLGTAPSAYSTSLDWWVLDTERRLDGFTHPEYYGRSNHAVSFLDYLTPELRAALEPKFVRDEAPIGGRIDYDVPDRLVGAWFLETDPVRFDETDHQLAFVYSVHDPDLLRVSVGGTVTDAGRYAVVGNGPDPAVVGPATGTVAYRLQRVTGTGQVRPGVVATLLVEVVDTHRIRVEGFPGDHAAPTFTEDAVNYTR